MEGWGGPCRPVQFQTEYDKTASLQQGAGEGHADQGSSTQNMIRQQAYYIRLNCMVMIE